MAEVRKKVVEDKYNTSSIKTETKKVENKKKPFLQILKKWHIFFVE